MRKELCLEEQKEEILEIADNQFGKIFFERLEAMSNSFSFEEDIKLPEYNVVSNSKGAFYAIED